MAVSAQADATKTACLAPPISDCQFQRLRLPAGGSGVGSGEAPPVRARRVNFSPQPSCRLVMAVSAQANATKTACLAPPISDCQFQRRLRLPAGGSGVGSGEAPPVRTRSVDFSPQPSCRQLAVSAQADATEAACLAPPISGGWFERRLRLPAGGSGVGSGEAPPVSPRSVAFSPQPSCRLVMAASAQADATEAACLAPPVCGGWFQRRLRLPAGGSGVGSGEAPPVRTRGLDLRPQPDFFGS